MVQPLKGIKLDQPWRGWVEELTSAINSAATKLTSIVENNVLVVSSTGDLEDSGVPISDLATEDYVDLAVIRVPAESFLTENTLPEAGTEDGARYGSFKIGLLSDDDYAFFDENGKLIFYGTAGVQLITPVNLTTTPTMFAVLDSSGNLKYRTVAQLASDLSISTEIEQVKQWVAERFITENLLDEAQVEDYSTLTTAANNAAAETAGVKIGDFYRTNADPSVVCVRTV